jgi:hypothetical protein
MATRERQAQADRLRDYFALQLAFADHMAAVAGLPLDEAMGRYTNLRRRLGLGEPHEPPSPGWMDYLACLSAAGSPEGRLDWTLAAFMAGPPDPARVNPFGCFRCDPPNEHGAVKIHFTNQDGDDEAGPLNRARTTRRIEELRAMFAFVREAYPAAASVQGGSWLYNLDAYRRLFPVEYGASRVRPVGEVRLSGTSTWGQVLDYRGAVKTEVRDHFQRSWRDIEVARPWLAFPLPALRTQAPIGLFYEFYGLEGPPA